MNHLGQFFIPDVRGSFFHFNTAFIWVGIPGMIYCGYWCNLFALHIFLTEYGNLLAPSSSQPKMKGEVWKINACLLLQHTCVYEIQAVIHNWHSAMIYSQYYHSISFCRKQFHPLGKSFFSYTPICHKSAHNSWIIAVVFFFNSILCSDEGDAVIKGICWSSC